MDRDENLRQVARNMKSQEGVVLHISHDFLWYALEIRR